MLVLKRMLSRADWTCCLSIRACHLRVSNLRAVVALYWFGIEGQEFGVGAFVVSGDLNCVGWLFGALFEDSFECAVFDFDVICEPNAFLGHVKLVIFEIEASSPVMMQSWPVYLLMKAFSMVTSLSLIGSEYWSKLVPEYLNNNSCLPCS
ncbi:hypothetical protein BpHYR1_015109 [Brachionus plicatilis]|uniref:Uncharacterized protein n=1 Tax=Brachionus plicatilis TaxID=10195 RepID=A0A3M7SA85_BRAPC|nr:hypothetical protein BpHYR1_015109 [Brachionus plicatilis]